MVVVYQVPPSCTATSTAVAAARRTAVQQPRHDPAAAVRTRARVMIRKQSAVGRTHNTGKRLYPQAFPQVREYSFSLYKYNAMCGGRGLRPLGIHARLQSLSTTAVCAYACLLCTGTRYRVPGHVRMYLEEFLGKRAEGRPIKRRSDPVSTAVSCRCLVRHKKVEANTTLHVLLSRHRWSLNKRV